MRIRLFHKLLLVLLGTTLCSVLLFAVFAQTYSSRSFLRYLNDERNTRLDALSEQLLRIHARDGDWHTLRHDERAWRQLLRAVGRGDRTDDDRQPQAPLPLSGGRRPAPERLRFVHRVEPTLYDPALQVIVGPSPFREDLIMRPINSGGHVLAYVGVPPLRRPADPRDVRFAQRQARILLAGAAVALVLSLVVATLVARRLSRPIVELGAGTRALASGHFATRLTALGDDEIGALVGDFNLLAHTLEESESARRRWFADVSHELRTPLAIMRGELEAALDGIRDIDTLLVESLSQETKRLTRLVDDLYQLARADIGTLDYEFTRASLSALLTEALSHFARRLQQAGIEYVYDIDADLCAQLDQPRILQLFENLLENCVRYTDAPGRMSVTAHRVAGQAVITFADSAPAVDEADLGLLFEPLHRGERSRSRAFGGSGLGLAICKRIVLAHDGNIASEPCALGGLAIVVRLPLLSQET